MAQRVGATGSWSGGGGLQQTAGDLIVAEAVYMLLLQELLLTGSGGVLVSEGLGVAQLSDGLLL